MNALTSRKFILSAVSLGASIGGLFSGAIPSGDWIVIIGIITGIYGAANVTQKLKGGAK